jgi:hypothetical protein
MATENAGGHRCRTPGEVADAILARYARPDAGRTAAGRELAAMLHRFATDQARAAAHDFARAAAA